MHPVAVAFIVLFVAGLSLWGWGWMALRVVGVPTAAWPLSIALGMSAIIFLGGLLNLGHVARPPVFDLVLALGLGVAGIGITRAWRRPRRPIAMGVLGPAVLVLLVALFVGCSLLPTAAYNVHDDFEKYFAVTVRMLTTGTLAPNPLSSVGAETLGGQAFLHGFVAAHFPLSYLNAVDAWFCLVLLLAIMAFGWPVSRFGIGAAAAVICAWAIDPMIVNISALFSGAALIAAAVFLGVRVTTPDALGREGWLLGLLYAALLALKPTFAVFVGFHAFALVTVSGSLGRGRRRWFVWAIAGTVVFFVPWFILHLPLYLTPAQTQMAIPPGRDHEVALFSRQLSGYGTAQISYTIVALGAFVVTTLAAFRWWRNPITRTPARGAAVAAGLAAVGAYVVFVVMLGPSVFGPYGATRYACPVLIGAVPALMRLFEPPDRRAAKATGAILLLAAVVVALVFLPSTIERPLRWWRWRTPLAFFAIPLPEKDVAYVEYNREALNGSIRSHVRSMQALVPPGEPLATWITTPFLLDFQRNPIYDAEPAGVSLRWSHWPAGVRYALVEYQGFAVRMVNEFNDLAKSDLPVNRLTAVRSIAFLEWLRRHVESGQILYHDRSYLLVRLEPGSADRF